MLGTIYYDEQVLLQALLELHCPSGIELDPMYSKGNFYKEIPQPKYKFDINPIVLWVEKADARSLPIENKSINCMILDPPFCFGIHGKTEQYRSAKRFGILKNFQILQELYKGITKEAYRVLKKSGILIFKCQDYTDSKTTMTHCLVWKWATAIGFYAKDLAILVRKSEKYNPNLKQRHLRKTHCYFWIFQKRNKTKKGEINASYKT